MTSACSHIQIDNGPRRRVILKHEGRWNLYLRRLLKGGGSPLPTPDFERDCSFGRIYLKVGQQPQPRPKRPEWGGGCGFRASLNAGSS